MAPRGRSFSVVRTPDLIRRYLLGETFTVVPPGQTEPVQRSVDPGEGDYVAHIHQAVKQRILEAKPKYQYPRRHSFNTWVEHLITLGLIEKADRQEEPQERGARAGTAAGFQQRVWVKIVLAERDSPLWQDPMQAIMEHYGITRPERPSPRVPVPVAPVPVAVAPVRVPQPRGERRPRRRAAGPEVAAEGPVSVPTVVLEEYQRLQTRRQGLGDQARFAAQQGESLEIFQSLYTAVRGYIGEVSSLYGGPSLAEINTLETSMQQRPIEQLERALSRLLGPAPVIDVILDLGTLRACVDTIQRVETGGQRRTALSACRASAGVLAKRLTIPLPPRRG